MTYAEIKMLTLDDLRKMDGPFITPQIAGHFTGEPGYNINMRARHRPDLMPFPFSIAGKKGQVVKIHRVPFIRYMEQVYGLN